MLTAAATRSSGLYLGRYPTVMDAEEADIMLTWADARRVALDSQGAIEQLSYTQARPWIEELQRLAREDTRQLMWVKGHSGVRRLTR